jgi:acyl-CoA thioesterase-1
MKTAWVAQILGCFLALFAATPLMAQSKPVRIMALGDSLTAGYGLAADRSFTAILQKSLRAAGYENVIVENAGVSGDTATGGLARLDWALGDGINAAIVELGANDMLRGINPAETEKALDQILAKLGQKKIPVLLAGMIAAPGMGTEYESRFNAIYPRLAEKHGSLFYAFFLDGVANEKKYLLNDGMHPNNDGVEEIVRRILPKVRELIARTQAN